MKYFFNIYSLETLQSSIAQKNTIFPFISVGTDRNDSDLILNNVYSLQYSFTSMSAPSSIDLVGFQRKSPRLGRVLSPKEIQSGDLIYGYEEDILIYVGQILEVIESYSNGGHILTLKFDTLLSQFGRQSMIQSINDVKVLAPSGKELSNFDFVFNTARIEDLLEFLMAESIFKLASQIQIFNPPFYGTPSLLNADTEVPYLPSTQSTKEAILLNSVFFYQVLIYQDPKGNIIIDTPSANNKSTFNVQNGDLDLRSWEFHRAESLVPNNVVYSLIYTGFFPPENNTNIVVKSLPSEENFPRLNFLYKSSYMSQVELITQNLDGGPINDPTLLEISMNNKNNPGIYTQVPPNAKNVPSTLNLPASRYLAQAITQSRYVIIELERNYRTKEIPIGKVFYLNSEPWFCTNVNIKCVGTGNMVVNTMTLFGVPLYSITGHWK